MKTFIKKMICVLCVLYVPFVLFSCGSGGDGSDTPTDVCEEGYEYIDGACNLTGTLTDTDADGISDGLDNCPQTWNPSQSTSGDTDSVADACDNCMYTDNSDQDDMDGDGIGDACEDDTDGDGVLDSTDNCDEAVNADQANADGDSCGDVCDDNDADATICNDADGDLIEDLSDNCPYATNVDQCDTDHDSKGNVCEDDTDGDGNPDSTDTTYPLNPSETCTADTDGDGICDDFDNCPSISNPCQSTADSDSDGLPDDCDTLIDDDGDGYASNDPDATKQDCNDTSASVYPGATEDCNDVDDDCDGDIDDGLEFTEYYPDADGDTYGDKSASPKTACEKPGTCSTSSTSTSGTGVRILYLVILCVEDHTDCDDSDDTIYPGNGDPDNTDDNQDNDCDGRVDENYEDEERVEEESWNGFILWQGENLYFSDSENRELTEVKAYIYDQSITPGTSSSGVKFKASAFAGFNNGGSDVDPFHYNIKYAFVAYNEKYMTHKIYSKTNISCAGGESGCGGRANSTGIEIDTAWYDKFSSHAVFLQGVSLKYKDSKKTNPNYFKTDVYLCQDTELNHYICWNAIMDGANEDHDYTLGINVVVIGYDPAQVETEEFGTGESEDSADKKYSYGEWDDKLYYYGRDGSDYDQITLPSSSSEVVTGLSAWGFVNADFQVWKIGNYVRKKTVDSTHIAPQMIGAAWQDSEKRKAPNKGVSITLMCTNSSVCNVIHQDQEVEGDCNTAGNHCTLTNAIEH